MAVMLHLEDETTAGLTTQDVAAPCPELQGTEPGPAFLLPQAAGGADPAPLCSLASFPGGTPQSSCLPSVLGWGPSGKQQLTEARWGFSCLASGHPSQALLRPAPA